MNVNKGINSWVAILTYLTLKIAGQVISGKFSGNFRHFLGNFSSDSFGRYFVTFWGQFFGHFFGVLQRFFKPVLIQQAKGCVLYRRIA